MNRAEEFLIGFLGVAFGSLATLTGAAMTIGMLWNPGTKATNLFWVGLVALAVAPPIFVAGLRLVFNRPNKHGGLFEPFALRALAVVNGIVGGMIVVLGAQARDIAGILGGVSYLLTTQGAFTLANRRSAT